MPVTEVLEKMERAITTILMSTSVNVTVPATTKLGTGFDCIGAALTLYNRFKFTRLTQVARPVSITVTGAEAQLVKTDKSNLVYQAYEVVSTSG